MQILLFIQSNVAGYNPGLFRNILLSDGFVENNDSTIISFLSLDEHISGTIKLRATSIKERVGACDGAEKYSATALVRSSSNAKACDT
jgi:hypothetical protein